MEFEKQDKVSEWSLSYIHVYLYTYMFGALTAGWKPALKVIPNEL